MGLEVGMMMLVIMHLGGWMVDLFLLVVDLGEVDLGVRILGVIFVVGVVEVI